jgi:hypothetical protein
MKNSKTKVMNTSKLLFSCNPSLKLKTNFLKNVIHLVSESGDPFRQNLTSTRPRHDSEQRSLLARQVQNLLRQNSISPRNSGKGKENKRMENSK